YVGDFGRSRLGFVRLADVRLFEALECGKRIRLRMTGVAKRADRRAERMKRRRAAGDEAARNHAIERGEHEPLRPSRSSEKRRESVGAKTVALQRGERFAAGANRKGRACRLHPA